LNNNEIRQSTLYKVYVRDPCNFVGNTSLTKHNVNIYILPFSQLLRFMQVDT